MNQSDDLTHQKSTGRERRYQLSAALLERVEALAAANPEEIFTVWGGNLRCYYASASTTIVRRGYRPEEMIGHHAREYVHVSDMAHLLLAKSDTELTGKSIEMTVAFRNKDGERIRVRSKTVLVKDPDSGKLFFLTRTVPLER